MQSFKIKRYCPLLILMICSSCNGQTKGSLSVSDNKKQYTYTGEQNLKHTKEEKLRRELIDFLPKYHKELNWAKNINSIYKVSEAYKALKPNPGYFFVKSGKSWTCFTLDYPVSMSSEFVELKTDNQYYYIGRKEINRDSDQRPKALSQTAEDEEGVSGAQFLPSTNEQEFELYDTTPIPDQYIGELSKQFREYKKVYRIPKSGGWAQTIVGYLKDNPSGAVTTDGPYDEKWRNEFKLEIIRNDIE